MTEHIRVNGIGVDLRCCVVSVGKTSHKSPHVAWVEVLHLAVLETSKRLDHFGAVGTYLHASVVIGLGSADESFGGRE